MSSRVFAKATKPVATTPTRRPNDPAPERNPLRRGPLKLRYKQPGYQGSSHGGADFDNTKIPLYPRAGIQTKQTIGHPHDKFEQAAEKIADTVMRRGTTPAQNNLPEIQEDNNPNKSGSAAIAGGQPLPETTRAQLGPQLGFDFSQVRIHSSKHSAEATQALKARAFTMGRDIFFGDGQYAPQTLKGQRLLVHELTHVVQQGHAIPLQPSGSARHENRIAGASSLATPTLQASFISFAIKMGAKKVAKGTLKNFIKTQIKAKIKKLANKKFAQRFAKEADDLVGILEDPWWATAIGFIPVVGDAFDLARVPKQIATAMRKADRLEERIKTILRIQGKKAANLISAKRKKSASYFSDLEDMTYARLVEMAEHGDTRARKMRKLIEEAHRLMEKL